MSAERRPVVLVIDDDEAARSLVGVALRRAGMEVLEAGSGDAGLQVVRETPVDLVVCDLRMPSMDGLQVVRALRDRSETATLPFILMTGSGDPDTVIEALEAGANDFVAKPVRLDELVARVHAHVRTTSAWSDVVEQALRGRAAVIGALAHLNAASTADEIAAEVVTVLGQRMDIAFSSILRVAATGRLVRLAAYDRDKGFIRRGTMLPSSRSRDLLAKAAAGPWVEHDPQRSPEEPVDDFWASAVRLVVRAPVYAGNRVVALLTMADGSREIGADRTEESRLLAATIDFAGVLSAIAGTSLADRSEADAERQRLRRILSGRQFATAFQPIVELKSGAIAGWEALTRFNDGVAPDVRFAEARMSELGDEFELAAIEMALDVAHGLPADRMLTVNISPSVVLDAVRRLEKLLADSDRPVVLELSEHAAISDYEAIRSAVGRLGPVVLAVDDAGAGYASLRHLLELHPALAKLDISLVRGIDGDPVRQALVAGLAFYAQRTGCRLVAEGVEEAAERAVLVALGVELGQGYLFGRPEQIEAVRRD
ncbi:MAG: EAL domain-containing protein [Candidatus Limnocylindrales bacterium]